MIIPFLVFFPFIGGLLCAVTGKQEQRETIRDFLADGVTILVFAAAIYLAVTFGNQAMSGETMTFSIPKICGFGLNFTVDGFRLIYAGVAGLMWMMTTVLSREYFMHHKNRNRFYLFLLLTEGATMGVFLSADLYTTFIFFEIMSFTSYVWVAQEENEPSLRAAATYLAVAVIGGLVMLMGLFLLYHELGTLDMSELHAAAAACDHKNVLYAAGACLLFGFGAKAGAFPLHIWLPKAHPVAPAPASALLSGILTKVGVFGILITSAQIFLHDELWGSIVFTIGVLTMFGGAVLGVFSIDLKRTLACSSMSQIGFILVGVGMQGLLGEENALAVHGTLLHMMNHSMIKLVLFMAAGVIYMNTHELSLNKIRGFGRKKPLLKVIFLIGALAIGGIPMFGGYVSKTLLHESIVEYGSVGYMKAAEWIFLFSGGLTVAYMTKLFVCIFVEKNSDAETQKQFDTKKKYMNKESIFALGGSALILLIWGLVPGALMDKAAELGQRFMNLTEFGHRVHYFSLNNLKGALISIIIGALVYMIFVRHVLMKKDDKKNLVYVNEWPQWFDMEDGLYRPVVLMILPFLFGVICRALDSLIDTVVVLLRKSVLSDSPIPHERTEGTFITAFFGHVINAFVRMKRIVTRNGRSEKNYVHILAMKHEEIVENNRIIARSLSFGLMLAGVGFVLTMIYLIWF